MRYCKEINNTNETDTDTNSDIEIQRGGVVHPLKVVKKEMARHVNLLLTEQDGLHYYSTIVNFSRLVGCQYNKNGHKIFYCYSCLHGFTPTKGGKDRSECLLLQEHQKYCKALKPQRVFSPEKDDILHLRVYTNNSKHRLLCTQTWKVASNLKVKMTSIID